MSNVFIDEINSYFLEQGLVGMQVSDADGNLVDVPVTYHMPEGEGEEDFKDTRITFFFYDMLPDLKRFINAPLEVVSRDDVTNEVITKEPPIPYKLYYQIDLWSEWNEDIMVLVPQLLKRFPPFCDLAITDKDGITHHMFMELYDQKQADSRLWANANKQTDQRFFRSVFRYIIHTELDANQLKSFKMAREVNIEATENEGGENLA